MRYEGSAALPVGDTTFSFDPARPNMARRALGPLPPRQMAATRAFAQALDAASLGASLVERAALSLELRFAEDGCDLTKLSTTESAFMATHRWTVSSLPLELVTRTVAAARKLREAVASYEPLAGTPVPGNAVIHEIGASTETRVDVICLLNMQPS